jgi:hypothetical protein
MLQIVGRNTIGSPVPNEREKCGPSSESGLAHDAQIGDDLLQFKVFIFQNETIQKLCVSFSFIYFRKEVYEEITQSSKVSGVRWRRFPILTDLLKGHRRGELTVFTGPTGAGKTTFLSEYSLDLCGQDVRTLWGSFEIRNVRLAKMMLQQFSGLLLENETRETFDIVADKFEKLPMYYLAFHGQQNVISVLEVNNKMTHFI